MPLQFPHNKYNTILLVALRPNLQLQGMRLPIADTIEEIIQL